MKPGTRQHGPATLRLSHNTSVPAHLRGGVLEVSHVFTPEQDRNKGYASMLLHKVCAEADAGGKVLLLMPKPYDTAPVDTAKLVEWYSAFGFEPIQASPILMARKVGTVARVKMKPLAAAMGMH